MPTYRECLLGPLTLLCRPAEPRLKPGSSPASHPGNPLGQRHQCGARNLWGRVLYARMGHPTTSKPQFGPGAGWMPLPVNRPIVGLQSHQGLPLQCGYWLTLSHWLLVPSTSEGVQSSSISAWIHLWGWLTGSGSSFSLGQCWDQDWPADGWVGTSGLAPPVYAGQCWGPLLGDCHVESLGMEEEGLGASFHTLAVPSTRKMVRPWGNVGSLPYPPSTSNLTCFSLVSPQ